MNISKRISDYNKKVAEIICNNACYKYCTAECKCRFNAEVLSDRDTDVIVDMFYAMLDDISAEIRGNSDSSVQCYSDYYKGTDVIDWSNIISKVEQSISGEIGKCKHSDNNSKQLIEKIAQKLANKVNVSRIAEIVYYKENHRYYDKALESTYNEVVVAVVQDSKDILSKRVYKQIQKVTAEITAVAAQQVYDSIYNKPAVKDKYKPSMEQFIESSSDTPYYFTMTQMFSRPSIELWFENMRYYEMAMNSIDPEYKSWLSCFKSAKSSLPMSKNTFLAYVKKHIPNLLGIHDVFCSTFDGRYEGEYVAGVIGDELCAIVSICYDLFKKRGKSFVYKSRFELIQSIDDVTNFSYIADVFMQMIALRLSQAEYESFIHQLENEDVTDRKEVVMLIAAAEACVE